ncbi:MAG TPA: hypothetical protein PKC55_10555 [Dysgonomonas sp.]|uniref:hypothetical protein n=1 Tax=unclassified Dysgonomonas TaxID=2630389 RepID=UPI0025B8EEE7|nr:MULTISPECIES: hypothetical protein [unclassified Dysgonomonas]HML65261.1 hypothetical protein [Dysgonomonas sp.]
MSSFDSKFCTTTKEQWLQEFLDKVDFGALFQKIEETREYRSKNPDWDRPVVMYGIRKKHTCIKKQEIAVIIDLMPWQERARMAETHWYKIIYKRPATDLEWKEMEMRNPVKRYWIWSYFIEKGRTIDKIVSHIVQDDSDEYGLETAKQIKAFEDHYQRRIRIYRRETAVQLSLF